MKTNEWNTATEILDVIEKLKLNKVRAPAPSMPYFYGYTDALSDVRAAVWKIRDDLDEYPDADPWD